MLRKSIKSSVFLVLFLALFFSCGLIFAQEGGRVRVVLAKGTHYQAGYQIGTQMKAELRELIQ